MHLRGIDKTSEATASFYLHDHNAYISMIVYTGKPHMLFKINLQDNCCNIMLFI